MASALEAVKKQLTEIHASLEVVKNEQRHLHADLLALTGRVCEGNGRIAKLENWRWMIIGGLMVIGSGVGILFIKLLAEKGV